MADIRRLAEGEVEPLLDLITAEQSNVATGTSYIGTERDELRLELEDLDGWPEHALVAVHDGRLLGATFVGPEVAELVHAATVAVVGRMTLDQLWHAVPSFPTASEVWLRLLEASLD